MNDTWTPIVEELPLPSSLDDTEANDFRALVALNNAVGLAETGVTELDRSVAEMFAGLSDQSDYVSQIFVVRDGARIAGAMILGHASAEPTGADFDLMVLPEDQGRGIGEALVSRAEAETRALGRKILQTWTLHRAVPEGETLAPATGWGRIGRSPLARVLETHGFSLEQVERNSALDLQTQADAIEQRLAEALQAAGPDYRVVAWTIPTPPEWRDGYAWVTSRMSTDAPTGDMEVDEEVWDAARIERHDARLLAGKQTMSVAAVEHVPTGTLAAFNELVIGPGADEITHQYNTLVLKEHRGHRLGMIVKCANLLRWREVAPGSPKVSTFNAEENRPMLDINEAIGFVPISYAGAWQKRLD